jgi:arginase
MTRLAVLGVPSSAGSYAAGQDLAPAALRDAGLIRLLAQAAIDVADEGDLPRQVWRPDRDNPLAQNADEVAAGLAELTHRIRPLLFAGDDVLVLGGNCTVALSVMAALQEADNGRSGLLYIDRHFDLNTPDTTTDGALDWMGLAHALDQPGCVESLLNAFDRRPLLEPDQIAWLGVQEEAATHGERDRASRLGLNVVSSDELARTPTEAVRRALAFLPSGYFAVHVDVDVLDFTDAPLAESTDGRNTGPGLDQLATALRIAVGDPRSRVLSIGELNPTRSAGDPTTMTRFIAAIVAALA